MKFGAERLAADLRDLGYEVEVVSDQNQHPFVLIRNFTVELGRFANCVIDLGIPAPPDFPRAVGSSIHIRVTPQLLEPTDNIPNVRNILQSSLGPEWRYWSKNFGWNGERSTRTLMSQINQIFHDA